MSALRELLPTNVLCQSSFSALLVFSVKLSDTQVYEPQNEPFSVREKTRTHFLLTHKSPPCHIMLAAFGAWKFRGSDLGHEQGAPFIDGEHQGRFRANMAHLRC